MNWRLVAVVTCWSCYSAIPRACAQGPPRVASRSLDGAEQAPAPPVAADGYCVVTLRDRQQWRLGDEWLGLAFDGRQYYFAGKRELLIFAAAPLRYMPALGGDCVVTFTETGKRVAGQAKFGVVQGGRLYFFASELLRARFLEGPGAYVDADVADEGRCLVTRVQRGRDVPGRPETALVVGGVRRLFAGAHERGLYLQDPQRYNAASNMPNTPLPTEPALLAESLPSNSRRPPAAASAPIAASDPSDEAASADEPDGEELMLASEPVMGGYCPVTLLTKGLWTRGQYNEYVQVDHLVFYTAGPAEHDAMQADLARFVPALGGNCVVSMVDDGREVRGSVLHSTLYQNRLFLFANAETKARFDAQPPRYATIDLAANGDCVVTRAETGEAKPGFAEFAVWFDGLLYRFANDAQKQKFLKTPEKYAGLAAARTSGPTPSEPPLAPEGAAAAPLP